MAMNKAVYVSVLLLALLIAISCQEGASTEAADNKKEGGMLFTNTLGCDTKCNTRCENVHSRPQRCLKYCNLCCNKCKGCVPSGHFGNKDECPCYRDMKARSGKPKCP